MIPFELLGVEHEKLAIKAIKDCWGKYHLYKQDKDDLYQVAMLAITVAQKHFDPNKKVINKITGKEGTVQFSTYAYWVIVRHLLDAFVINGGVMRVPRYHFDRYVGHSEFRKKMHDKVNAAMNVAQMDDDLPEPVEDNPPDKRLEEHDEKLAVRRKLDKIKKSISAKDWNYLKEHYGKSATYLSMAEKEGVTRQRIQQRVQEALKRTRKVLGMQNR